jgi:tRNA 2-selenouridine synthase
LAWLLELYGFEVSVLEGGYKAFRRTLLDFFREPLPLRVLTGATGSKKTEVLHAMAEKGEQVIDLEGIARHRGSSFGTQATDGQPTTEQFQNELFEAFRHLDRDRPIWIEDESFRIGQVKMVEPLFHQKEAAPHYCIEIPYEERVKGLVRDYGSLPKEKLLRATDRIRKRLGHERTEAALQHIEEGELEAAVAIILSYYDKAYSKGIQKKEKLLQEKFSFKEGDPKAIAEALIEKERVL